MRAGKHREHEDFQVYDLDVFYNGNLIVVGFFSSVTSVVHDIPQLKELINEVSNSTHLCFLSVFALSLTSLSHM